MEHFATWLKGYTGHTIYDFYALAPSESRAVAADKELIALLPVWIEEQHPTHVMIQSAFQELYQEGR